MQKVFAFVLVLVALAFGQSRTTINYLNGTTAYGAITNILNDPNALAPVIYAYMPPANAGFLQIEITNLNNAQCSYIYTYTVSDVIPCVEDTFGLGNADRSFCSEVYSQYAYSDSTTIIENGYSNYYFTYQPGKYVYIGVGTYVSYTGSVCSYSLLVSPNTTCPMGQVGTDTGDDNAMCIPTITIANPNNYTFALNNATSSGAAQEFQIAVPLNTASVSFTVSSTEYFYIYGTSNYGTAGYTNYDCYTSGSSNGDNYNATLTCYTPEAGNFFFYFESTSSPNEATLYVNASSAIQVCTGTMLGDNCQFPSTQINISNPMASNFLVPYNSSDYQYVYQYFDVPAVAPTQSVMMNIFLNNVTGNEDLYYIVTKDSIPLRNQYRSSFQSQNIDDPNEGDFWLFSWQDFAIQNRIYIGYWCYYTTGAGCNVTVSFNGTSSTTGTTGTTGVTASSTTGTASSTTGTASSTTGTTGITTGTTGITTGTTGITTGNSTGVTSMFLTTSSGSALVSGLLVLIAAALF